MTPVPQQAKKPMGQDNARRVFLSTALGKLHARYLRSDATRHVQSAVLPTQMCGFPSKTIEFGNHLVHQRAAFYEQKGITSAVIFLDLTAAFHCARARFGPSSGRKSARAVVLGALSSCMEAFRLIPRGFKLRFWTGVALPRLHRAIAAWHTDTFFRVRHTEQSPGDPLADLIFNACMTGFICD